jgi:hypothetical protein
LDRGAHRRDAAAAPATASTATSAATPVPASGEPSGEGPDLPVPQAGSNPPTRHAFSVKPGTFAAYATSTLQPGTPLRGKMVLERNGDFLYTGTNGVKVRGTLNFAAPDRITGTATATQPKVLGVPLIRYPDGSSSTNITIRAQIVGGKLQGRYSDQFETGELVADLSNPL